MTIIINDKPEELAEDICTLKALLEQRGVQAAGTAVAVNDKLIRQSEWETANLKEGDRLVIISAAYGG